MSKRAAVPILAAVLGLAYACLPPGNPRSVYSIQTWTVNDTACDTPGRDNRQFLEDRFAVNPEPGEDGGMPIVVAATCSYSTCIARTDRNDADAWKLDRVTDQLYTRDLIATDFVGVCSGYVEYRSLTLVNEPRTFLMERRRRPYMLASSACTDDEKRSAAAANPCNYLEVITGPFDREEQESSGSSFDDD